MYVTSSAHHQAYVLRWRSFTKVGNIRLNHDLVKTSLYYIEYVKNFLHFLHMVASLGMPTNIPLGKQRRLDELADFIATLQIGNSPATAIHEGLAVPPEQLRDLIHATAILGGFEVDVLAAEARSTA